MGGWLISVVSAESALSAVLLSDVSVCHGVHAVGNGDGEVVGGDGGFASGVVDLVGRRAM